MDSELGLALACCKHALCPAAWGLLHVDSRTQAHLSTHHAWSQVLPVYQGERGAARVSPQLLMESTAKVSRTARDR